MRDIYDIVDDLFTVFEEMRTLFRHWNNEGPAAFMEGVGRMRMLEKELEQVLGDAEKTHVLIRGIYLSIFPASSHLSK